MTIKEVGRYRNLAPIGRGGMGEIFRADDPSLHRVVALKFIASEHVGKPAERLRLMREARAAAALNHPFVCTIHEVLDGEQTVIVMELVEGETLRERLRRGALPASEVVAVGGEILEALCAAHAKGIIHRDIKSANVMLTPSGHVKVMDFGLAIPAEVIATDETVEQVTQAGGISGTVTHMAPELLQGAPADVATDLYACGVVLYEMCAGRLPFVATGNALVAEVLKGNEPPPPSRFGSVPPELERLVMDLIDRDRTRRPASARAALARLRAVMAPISATGGSAPSVAVLPFRTLTPDAEATTLGVALADATISELSLLRSLTVRPTAAILSYAETSVDPVEAGRALGVDAVVHGTFQRSGSRLRVTVQLIRTAEARSIWASKIDTSMGDIFATQDEVSRRIAGALEVELTPADAKRLARVEAPAGPAYEAYVGGLIHLFRETLADTNAAIDAFRKSVEIDPGFALGWAALAEAYIILGYSIDPNPQWIERAEELTAKALSIDPRLPEGRYLQGRLAWNPANGWDHVRAIRDFAAAIAGRPNLAQAHDWMATILVHTGVMEEARMHLLRALDIVPDDLVAKSTLAWFLLLDGRYADALALAEEIARGREIAGAYYVRAHIYLRQRELGLAEEVAERAAREYPNDVYFHPVRAIIAAMRGDSAAMRRAIDLTLASSHQFGHYHHAQYDIACAHALAGDTAEAARWLTDSARNGFPCDPMVDIDALLAPVRDAEDLRPIRAEMRSVGEACAVAYRDAMTRPYSDSTP